MKQITIIVLALATAMAATGCKRASDVLATYKGGRVARGEFHEWMDARRMAQEAILKKKSQQKTHLERLVIEKLSVQEAKKAGFDKREDYNYMQNLAVRNFYAQYIGRQLSTAGTFKEKAAKTRIIKLAVKNYKSGSKKGEKLTEGEMESAVNEKMDKARSIIKELAKGELFEDLAKKYSDDFSKRKGGDIGYVIEGMRGEEFSKAVFAVTKGEFTKEPVRIGNAVYIIQVDDSVELTQDNIEDVIEDKVQQTGLKRRLTYNAAQRLQERLMKTKDVENNADTVVLANPAAVVYKVGTKTFTVADLNKLVGFILSKRKQAGRPDMKIEDKMKRELAKRILREEVMMREAIKRGVDKDEKFKKELAFYVDHNLATTYESEAVLAGITVTPHDVREYYTKNLDRMYTRSINEGGKTVKKVIPFEEVRQSIEHRQYDVKKSEKRKAWVDQLLRENNFKIDDSELEGK